MKTRQFGRLADVPVGQRLAKLAEGLSIIHEHVVALEAAHDSLAEHVPGRAASLLGITATEEAGKFLILLDAARLDQQDRETVREQLRRAGSHLAKHIYAEAHSGSPATFGEVAGYVESMRASHYLDGPRDFDWIFRNELISRRESLLYVDLVDGENGLEWWAPDVYDRLSLSVSPTSTRLVGALHRTGLTAPQTLAALADIWSGFELKDDTHYQELLPRIDESLVLAAQFVETPVDARDIEIVRSFWTFPMMGLEVKEDPVSRADLMAVRQVQEERWWREELGEL
ncbi:MAG: AbiV family abortive infection protein [Acidimicrobiales bacterium]|nr:AbiV family abortive infection protein [Acidimicrobiales bacterium]